MRNISDNCSISKSRRWPINLTRCSRTRRRLTLCRQSLYSTWICRWRRRHCRCCSYLHDSNDGGDRRRCCRTISCPSRTSCCTLSCSRVVWLAVDSLLIYYYYYCYCCVLILAVVGVEQQQQHSSSRPYRFEATMPRLLADHLDLDFLLHLDLDLLMERW